MCFLFFWKGGFILNLGEFIFNIFFFKQCSDRHWLFLFITSVAPVSAPILPWIQLGDTQMLQKRWNDGPNLMDTTACIPSDRRDVPVLWLWLSQASCSFLQLQHLPRWERWGFFWWDQAAFPVLSDLSEHVILNCELFLFPLSWSAFRIFLLRDYVIRKKFKTIRNLLLKFFWWVENRRKRCYLQRPVAPPCLLFSWLFKNQTCADLWAATNAWLRRFQRRWAGSSLHSYH